MPDWFWFASIWLSVLSEPNKLFCLQVFQDVGADEFIMFMTILSGLKCMQTLQGRQQLTDIISEQAGFDNSFEVNSCLARRALLIPEW